MTQDRTDKALLELHRLAEQAQSSIIITPAQKRTITIAYNLAAELAQRVKYLEKDLTRAIRRIEQLYDTRIVFEDRMAAAILRPDDRTRQTDCEFSPNGKAKKDGT